MNEYQIAGWCGIAIAALWVLAYLFCWLVQWAWAWVDDGEIQKQNWLSSKINFSEYKYRVYNDHHTKESRSKKQSEEDDGHFRYSKNKDDEGKSIYISKIKYKCSFQTYGGILTVGFLTSLLPIFSLVAFKLYSVTLIVLTLMVIAWVARFSRRHKKLFDKHIKDKDAHN